MKSIKKIMMIAALLSIFFVVQSVEAETGVETDPKDDVITFNQLDTDEFEQTTTSEVPNADLTRVSYTHTDGQTEVTVSFTVNDRGKIETLDLLNMENQDEVLELLLNSSGPLPLAYNIYVITDQANYEVTIQGENCTLNYEEEINYTIDDNVFSATFNLNNASESISKIGAQSFFMDFSFDSANIYMDAAPDSFLFIANIDAPTTAKTGEQIEFTGFTTNLADLMNLGLSDMDYTYEWDFDDGTTGSGETVTHTYQYPGTYTVELTVSDTEGTETSAKTEITVTQGSSTTNGNSNNGGNPDDGSGNGSPIMIFIAIIGIIVVIGVVALIVVIRR